MQYHECFEHGSDVYSSAALRTRLLIYTIFTCMLYRVGPTFISYREGSMKQRGSGNRNALAAFVRTLTRWICLTEWRAGLTGALCCSVLCLVQICQDPVKTTSLIGPLFHITTLLILDSAFKLCNFTNMQVNQVEASSAECDETTPVRCEKNMCRGFMVVVCERIRKAENKRTKEQKNKMQATGISRISFSHRRGSERVPS